MELKINEAEVKALLEGLEKLLKVHDERIINAINAATCRIENSLDNLGDQGIIDAIKDAADNIEFTLDDTIGTYIRNIFEEMLSDKNNKGD